MESDKNPSELIREIIASKRAVVKEDVDDATYSSDEASDD